ncbi:MAG: hypothetical protein EBQ96_04655 [Proteobacteria bacterium]|nr:hypothetical protein [Pseudomonadota bacterium]
MIFPEGTASFVEAAPKRRQHEKGIPQAIRLGPLEASATNPFQNLFIRYHTPELCFRNSNDK